MRDVVLYVEEFESSNIHCRICHEEEYESCRSFEAPCACSGTVKFAHRDCIQRWCDEKGNTVCEICLQKYEPGYTAAVPKKSKLDDEPVTLSIRGSLQVPRTVQEVQSPGVAEDEGEVEFEDDGRASRCRTFALVFTILLLVRHVFTTVTGGTGQYPFSLFTVISLRACGIIIPMYILIRTVAAIHSSIRQRQSQHHMGNVDGDASSDTDEEEAEDEEDYEPQLHLV